jgi:hypothetical protein
MRGVSKSLLALAVVALLAFGLSACGGGDDSTDSTATTAQESTATTPSQGGSDDQGQQQTQGEDQNGGQGQGSEDPSGSEDSSAEEGNASFRTPGGDNSIQNYGEEPDGSEVEAAEAVLDDFMEARAASDWSGICASLAAAAVAPLEDLAAKASQLKGKGCPAILAALLSRAPASSRANTLTDGIASFRVEGDRGFALYHGPKGVNYFVPMVKEDGEWRVGSLAPSEFP